MNRNPGTYNKYNIFGSSIDKNAVLRPFFLVGIKLTYRTSGNYIVGLSYLSSRSYQRGLKRYTTTIRRRRSTIRINGSSNPVGAIIGVVCCLLCYCCVGAIWFLFFRAVAQAGSSTQVVVIDGGPQEECVEEVVEEVVVEEGYEGGEK